MCNFTNIIVILILRFWNDDFIHFTSSHRDFKEMGTEVAWVSAWISVACCSGDFCVYWKHTLIKLVLGIKVLSHLNTLGGGMKSHQHRHRKQYNLISYVLVNFDLWMLSKAFVHIIENMVLLSSMRE